MNDRLSVIVACLGVVVFYLRACHLLINVLLNRPNNYIKYHYPNIICKSEHVCPKANYHLM